MRSKIVILFLLLTVSLYGQERSSLDSIFGLNKGPYSLYGLIAQDGTEILPIEYLVINYDLYSEATYNSVSYRKDGKMGTISTLGKVQIPPIFSSLAVVSPEGLFWGKRYEENSTFGIYNERYPTLYNAKGEVVTGPTYDKKGEALSGPEYTRAGSYRNGLVAVRTTKGAGVLNKKGEEVIPCIYRDTKLYNNANFIHLKKGEEEGVAVANGKIIIPLKKQEIEIDTYGMGYNNKELAVVTIEGKKGLIDTTGHWRLEPKYDILYLDGYFGYVRDFNKYGLTNPSGYIIGSVDFDYVDPLKRRGHGGGAILRKGDRWSYIDSTGTELFHSKHKIIENISHLCPSIIPQLYCPRLTVLHDSIGYSAYDLYGNLQEESTTDKSPTYTWICFGRDKLGYKDSWNNVTIYPQYKWVSDGFRYGYAVVKPKNKLGIIDKDNNMIIPAEYDYAAVVSPNSCLLKKKGKYALYDMQGNPLTPFIYKRVEGIQDGYLSVLKDKKLGVCEPSTGKVVIPFEYESISYFSDLYFYYIIVSQNKKEGILDLQTGRTIIPCLYDEIKMDTKRTGSTLIRQGNKWGVIDLSSSQEIIPCQWDEISPISFNKQEIVEERTINGENYKDISKMYRVRTGSLWGLLNGSGNEIIPPMYNTIENFYNDLLIVSKKYERQDTTK